MRLRAALEIALVNVYLMGRFVDVGHMDGINETYKK